MCQNHLRVQNMRHFVTFKMARTVLRAIFIRVYFHNFMKYKTSKTLYNVQLLVEDIRHIANQSYDHKHNCWEIRSYISCVMHKNEKLCKYIWQANRQDHQVHRKTFTKQKHSHSIHSNSLTAESDENGLRAISNCSWIPNPHNRLALTILLISSDIHNATISDDTAMTQPKHA